MHDPYDEFDAREMRFERAENARPYDDSTNPASVENRIDNLPAADVCEDWLTTLARANDEYGVPSRETIEDIWRSLRWTIGYKKGMDEVNEIDRYKVIDRTTGKEVEDCVVLRPATDYGARDGLRDYVKRIRRNNPAYAEDIEVLLDILDDRSRSMGDAIGREF